MNLDTIFTNIINKNSEDDIISKIDEAMSDFVDTDTVDDEFDGDLYECYCETGGHAAESQTVMELLEPYKENISDSAYLELWEKITIHYDIQTS